MATLSHAMKSFRTAAVVGAGVLMACATPAMALETGCQDANTVRAALQEEGQFVLVNGVRPVPGNPRNIFTSNADGSLGYNVEEGAPNTLCVGARYTDIRVNQNANLAIPTWAFRGQGTAHDRWLTETSARTGETVLLGATVLRRDESGQDVRGAFMMVTRGRITGDNSTGLQNGGAVTITLNDGEIRPTICSPTLKKFNPTMTGLHSDQRSLPRYRVKSFPLIDRSLSPPLVAELVVSAHSSPRSLHWARPLLMD